MTYFDLLIFAYKYIAIIILHIIAGLAILLLIQFIFYRIFNINLYKIIMKKLFK